MEDAKIDRLANTGFFQECVAKVRAAIVTKPTGWWFDVRAVRKKLGIGADGCACRSQCVFIGRVLDYLVGVGELESASGGRSPKRYKKTE